MSIRMKLEGFEKLLFDIQRAGGNVERISKECITNSASIMQAELKEQMRKSGVDDGLINAMPPPKIEANYGKVTARVGYKKGVYDPRNLSDGYKIVFLNYGTPYRKKHGKILDRSDGGKIRLGFIKRAKSSAGKKIRVQQEKALQEALKGLQQ